MYYINKPVVNMYETISMTDEKDSTRSSIADQCLYGAPVEILEQVEDYYKIKTHYFYEGYVRQSELIVLEQEVTHQMVVTSQSVDVLMAPIVQGVPLMTLTRGCLIETLEGTEKGYQRVRLLDGREGFLPTNYLEVKRFPTNFTHSDIDYLLKTYFEGSEDAFRESLVQVAKSYLGTQYRWAGKTPLGIDCSGLTSMVYMLHGVLTFRDARIVDGFPVKEITREKMKPADLLYFPGHIALYIGKGYYIHSTGAEGVKGVKMNSFDAKDLLYRKDLDEKLYAVGSIFG